MGGNPKLGLKDTEAPELNPLIIILEFVQVKVKLVPKARLKLGGAGAMVFWVIVTRLEEEHPVKVFVAVTV